MAYLVISSKDCCITSGSIRPGSLGRLGKNIRPMTLETMSTEVSSFPKLVRVARIMDILRRF